jgi:hypothetical protein
VNTAAFIENAVTYNHIDSKTEIAGYFGTGGSQKGTVSAF